MRELGSGLRSKRSGGLVTPGERLGVIEEFHAGKGTYTEKGVIYSKTTGEAIIDMDRKEVSVRPVTRIPTVPRKGNIVVGEVLQVQDKMATVRLLKVNGEKLNRPYTAILHISYVTRGFLKNLHDALRPGDLIRARVVGDENLPYQLTTADRELGVIKAFCSFCGAPLNYNRRRRMLECPRCRKVEKRKVSEGYDLL